MIDKGTCTRCGRALKIRHFCPICDKEIHIGKPPLIRGRDILAIVNRGHLGCSGVPLYLEELIEAQRAADMRFYNG